jgi:hypothetical protein
MVSTTPKYVTLAYIGRLLTTERHFQQSREKAFDPLRMGLSPGAIADKGSVACDLRDR